LFVGNNVNESSQADKETYAVIIKGKTWVIY